MVFFIGLIILTLPVTMAIGGLAKQRLAAEYPAPGKLVDVGGYNLQINCQGEGYHTVLFEAKIDMFFMGEEPYQ